MATDMALKLEGIDGESLKKEHENQIDVVSFNYGATMSGVSHEGGGSTAGQANVQDVTIIKHVDKSSPLLFLNCLKGTHIPTATLYCRKQGGEAVDYLVITLKQVLVTSVQTGGSGTDDRVLETVNLNFSEISVQYTPQAGTGAGQGPVVKAWNVTQGAETG